MRIFCNSSKKAACILIDSTSASAIGRAAMSALAGCATKTAGRTCVLCSLSLQNKPTIMARSEVLRLEATSDRVTRAIVLQGDKQITIQAKVFVLAAGAIHTPKLLLQSSNDHWPDGVANRSGLVGRNLMFHAQQTFALWPSKRLPGTGPRKSSRFYAISMRSTANAADRFNQPDSD